MLTEDFETAEHYCNPCRSQDAQGPMTEYLICAVAVRQDMEIYTTDGDFKRYRKHLPIALYAGAPS